MAKEITQFEVYPKYRLHVAAEQRSDDPPRISLVLYNDYGTQNDPHSKIKEFLQPLEASHNAKLYHLCATVLPDDKDDPHWTSSETVSGVFEPKRVFGIPIPLDVSKPSSLELELPQYPTQEAAIAGVTQLLGDIRKIGEEQRKTTPEHPQQIPLLLYSMGSNAAIAKVTRAIGKIYDEHEKLPKPKSKAIDPDNFKDGGSSSITDRIPY